MSAAESVGRRNHWLVTPGAARRRWWSRGVVMVVVVQQRVRQVMVIAVSREEGSAPYGPAPSRRPHRRRRCCHLQVLRTVQRRQLQVLVQIRTAQWVLSSKWKKK